MTRSTRLATRLAALRLAALSLALSSVAVDASAAGLFGFLNRSNEKTEARPATNQTPAPTINATATNRATENAPTDLNSALIKAQLSRRVGDFQEATKILSQLVLFAPDDPRVVGEYGKTLAAQGKSDDALAFLERAIQLQPGEWSFHSAMGVVYDQKGNYPLAQSAYQRALTLKPGEPAVLNNAALSYMQTGDLETAERMIHEAETTSLDKTRIQSTLALIERAKASQPRTVAPQAPPVPMAPAPLPTYEPAPAQVASLAPEPQPPQQLVNNNYNEPIESNALPPLEEDVEDIVYVTPPMPEPEIEVASLQSNPAVVMQAVPKDELAGPVQQRAEPKKTAPAAPKPERKQLSVSANPPLTTAPKAAPAPKAPPVVHAYYVQAGAFASEERADKLASSLDSMGARVSPTTVNGRSLYRVRIGPFKDSQQANDALDVAKSLGHMDVKVVSE